MRDFVYQLRRLGLLTDSWKWLRTRSSVVLRSDKDPSGEHEATGILLALTRSFVNPPPTIHQIVVKAGFTFPTEAILWLFNNLAVLIKRGFS
jgi:hypothetical protein